MLPSLLLPPADAPWFTGNWGAGLKGDSRVSGAGGICQPDSEILEAKSELVSFSSELSGGSLSDGASSRKRRAGGSILVQETGGEAAGLKPPVITAMTLSNLTSASGEASVSSGTRGDVSNMPQVSSGPTPATPATPTTTTNTTNTSGQTPGGKRKRNLPGTPDPDAEVIALSPKTLMATNRFVCEICNKGFQRDQNLQLHRRGHNLPWKLRQRTSKEIRKRVYICPEPSCVHHDPSRALGDLTGIKKHFCRKHGEKKWKCDKCSKRYAVQSDWKAHSKTCGTREYRCDCGTLFSRRDSFITHRAFCDALAEESARVSAAKPGAPGGDHGLAGSSGNMSVMGAPGSPRSANMGRMDSISSTPPRPGMQGNIAGMGLGQDGMSMLPGRWVQGGAGPGAPNTPGTGTRLSLWSGPGPGPPGLMGGPQLQLGGNSQMNPMDGNSAFLMQPPKGMHGGMQGVMGGSDYDIPQPPRASGGMLPMNSSGSGSIFANLFAPGGGGLPGMQASVPGQSGGSMGMGMSGGFSDFTGGSTRLERGGSGAAGLSLSSSAGLTSSSSSANNYGAGSVPSGSSLLNQPQHTSTSQMSATALLQKAAQMGATASNSSLLRFGMGGNESNSIGLGALRQGPNRQDQGRGLPNISTGMSNLPQNVMRRPNDPSPGSQGMGSPLGASGFGGGPGRSGDHSGVQDFMNSLTGASGMFSTAGMGNLPPMFSGNQMGSANMGNMMPPSNSSMQQQRMQGGNDGLGHPQQQQQHQQQQHQQQQQFQQQQQHGGGPQPQGMPSSMMPGLGGLSKAEDGGDRLTRDFLGVGANTSGVGRNLMPQMGPGVDMASFNNQRENLRSVGASGQSPGKSWDGS